MYFIGIDLAWSEKNLTAIAILEGLQKPTLVDLTLCRTNHEILEIIRPLFKHPRITIGIDAPLIIPNQTGQRSTERAFLKDFARFRLGVHAVNRNLLLRYGDPIRSEILYQMLQKEGFSMEPDAVHFCTEVYPHATILALFNEGKVLPYKKKPGRSREEINANLTVLQSSLHSRIHTPHHRILTDTCDSLRPVHLKQFEDKLDSLVCAYTLWQWQDNPSQSRFYGDEKSGLLLAPIPPQQD